MYASYFSYKISTSSVSTIDNDVIDLNYILFMNWLLSGDNNQAGHVINSFLEGGVFGVHYILLVFPIIDNQIMFQRKKDTLILKWPLWLVKMWWIKMLLTSTLNSTRTFLLKWIVLFISVHLISNDDWRTCLNNAWLKKHL